MKKIIVLLALLSLVLCACENKRDDLVFIGESGKYVDELGNEISFSEDIYSVKLNYAIGWDTKTLSPIKIYMGDKISGMRVREVYSEYKFWDPIQIDPIMGTVSQFADKNAPLFFDSQTLRFGGLDEPISGYFAFDNDIIYFYPKYSEETNLCYLHNPQYKTYEIPDFAKKAGIEVQPIGIASFISNETPYGRNITKEDIEQKLGITWPEDTGYVKATVYFSWLVFESGKPTMYDIPERTTAKGFIEKIQFQ
ncbi:MAG: hypothetical protein IKL18_02090 [Oscillospiraceae bacterium]|nr:hypothetical protein [Oscillospiraceae bacterium]MBR3962480.1 hypothetical protein [Oscillospiraceae bacterium]MBR6656945.1 hypothetical protein [Oscillospiraceae bacterium]